MCLYYILSFYFIKIMFFFFQITYPGDDAHNEDPNAPTSEYKKTTIEQFRSGVDRLNRYELDSTNEGRMKILQNNEWYGHQPVGRVILEMLKRPT